MVRSTIHPFDSNQTEREAHALHLAVTHHPRQWESFRLVYPVISRRSQGLSIGINLNPDTACNFDCIYCCVDREHSTKPRPKHFEASDLVTVQQELSHLLQAVKDQSIWQSEPFRSVPRHYQRLNDIAFSGDGEPTTCPWFAQAVEMVGDMRKQLAPPETKIILITNATRLHKPDVINALDQLNQDQDEIWPKLDAGDAETYQQIDRSRVPFDLILRNIQTLAQRRPIRLQTLLMNIKGQPMSISMSLPQFDAYLNRVVEIVNAGGRIQGIQLYTIARQTAVDHVAPMTAQELQPYADSAQQRLSPYAISIDTYGSA